LKKNYLIHDYLENFGGGERLVFSLEELFDYFFLGFAKKQLGKNLNKKKFFFINNSFLPIQIKKILLIKSFQKLKIQNSKNILVSGNYSLFGNYNDVENKIYYIHSLPKVIYDPYYFYKNIYPKRKFFLNFFYNYKKNYENKIKEFDKLIVNSKKTQNTLKEILGLNSTIIHPPIFDKKKFTIKYENFYFSNNRHENEKNINVVINVFKKLHNSRLIISSSGSQTNRLKKLAMGHKNISFVGNLNEFKYHEYLSKCKALINISSNEDFGMGAIEGMVYGKPTFCLNDGGYLETTTNNINAIHIDKNNIELNLLDKITTTSDNKIKQMRHECFSTASKFSIKIFKNKISSLMI
jgi:glycosyltransferase involved in cell wall biosynthesis